MKKTFIKIIASIMMVTTMAVSMTTIPIAAVEAHKNTLVEECKGDPGFGIHHIPYEKQLQDILDNPKLTEAQKEMAVIAINEAIQIRETESKMQSINSRTTYTETTIGVTAYTQETNYYCGPATAYQTLKYLGGIVPGTYYPPSQSSIARAIYTTTNGTEWNYLIDYINGFNYMNTPHLYIEHHLSNLATMETTIYNSLIQSRPEPPILHINTNGNSSALGYSTDGHYLNVSGIRTKNGVNQFQLVDPFRQYDDLNLAPKYYVQTSVIYTFTDNHWASHFMC